MKGLYRGFCRNENGTETIVLNGERIKGKWKYGYLVERTENDGEVIGDKIKWEMIIKSFIFPEFKEGCYEVLPETVCEAVRGLTDRNGKQVFEGDIVNCVVIRGGGTWNNWERIINILWVLLVVII